MKLESTIKLSIGQRKASKKDVTTMDRAPEPRYSLVIMVIGFPILMAVN